MDFPKSKYPLPQQDYMVVVKCFTYNHGKYIEDTLKGFVIQKTNFPFCALVIDDFSTDDTAQIIRRYEEQYPDIIKGVYLQENYYSQGGIKREKTEIVSPWFERCKYIAMCEGDDYWTDPLKLQKQVDILENNEEYGCVYTAYETIDTMGNPIEFLPSKHHMSRSYTGDIFYELLVANFPQTLTVMFRKELIGRFSPPYNFDYSLFLSIAIQKNFYYIPEITGAYRINPKGMCQTGELCRRYDFKAVTLYFYIEYLRDKSFRREGDDHRKILNLLYQIKMWNLWTLRRYFPYFVEIVKCRPSSIFRILFYSVRNTYFPRLFKNKLRAIINKMHISF